MARQDRPAVGDVVDFYPIGGLDRFDATVKALRPERGDFHVDLEVAPLGTVVQDVDLGPYGPAPGCWSWQEDRRA